MPNIVKIKSSNTTATVPASLVNGEIAINQRDKILFYRNELGIIQSFSLVASGGTGGGSGWTYVKLTADAATTTTANTDTLLRFTPDASSHYEIEGKFFLESVAITTGVRPGIKWSTSGLLRNVAWIVSPTSATAFVSRFWGNTVAANAASTAVPVANEGLYGEVNAMFVTDTVTAGDFIITIATEIAGSQVKINGDSYIRYRKVI
jgi:hypothetical protein